MGLHILNGSHGSDVNGDRGASVIDYIICSKNALPYISDFFVDTRAESYHMPVVINLSLPVPNGDSQIITPPRGTVVPRYKWLPCEKESYETSSLKNKKAPGIDGVPAEFYKYAIENDLIVEGWLRAFNALFLMGETYSDWDTSIMHTIYKNKGDRNSPDNYRGIALAPILSKVYSKMLYARLQTWSLLENKITLLQAGFRPGYCTVDNIFVLDHMIKKYLSQRNGKLYCAFIDFQKAFDTVNRKKLWARLWQMGCSSRMIEALM
ncbi:hypothetical protein B566_EDAN010836, partial [Ephemera danica]